MKYLGILFNKYRAIKWNWTSLLTQAINYNYIPSEYATKSLIVNFQIDWIHLLDVAQIQYYPTWI